MPEPNPHRRPFRGHSDRSFQWSTSKRQTRTQKRAVVAPCSPRLAPYHHHFGRGWALRGRKTRVQLLTDSPTSHQVRCHNCGSFPGRATRGLPARRDSAGRLAGVEWEPRSWSGCCAGLRTVLKSWWPDLRESLASSVVRVGASRRIAGLGAAADPVSVVSTPHLVLGKRNPGRGTRCGGKQG